MYNNVVAEMIKSRETLENMAKKMKIKQEILKQKIEGKKEFKINEILMLLAIFGNISCDYLFFNKEK